MPEALSNSNQNTELKRIRTFQGDVEEFMQSEDVSLSKIAVAENEKRAANPVQPSPFASGADRRTGLRTLSSLRGGAGQTPRRIGLYGIIGAAVLFALAVGVFFLFRAFRTPAPAPLDVASATTAKYAITLAPRETRASFIKRVRAEIAGASPAVNAVESISILLDGAPITTPLFLEMLAARAPAALPRALGATPRIGMHAFRGGQLFIVWDVVAFERAFAGMLSFEKTLLDDFGPLFGLDPRQFGATTASTTGDSLGNIVAFKDVIIKNKDARALFGGDGTIVFLYSFLDKQILLMTTSDETVRTLLNKVIAGKLRI